MAVDRNNFKIDLINLSQKEVFPRGVTVQGVPEKSLLNLCDRLKLPCAPEMLQSCRSDPSKRVTKPEDLLQGAQGAVPSDIEFHLRIQHAHEKWSSQNLLRFDSGEMNPPLSVGFTRISQSQQDFSVNLSFPLVPSVHDDPMKDWSLVEDVLVELGEPLSRLREGFRVYDLEKEVRLSERAAVVCSVPVLAAQLEEAFTAPKRNALERKTAVHLLAPTSLTLIGLHESEIRALIGGLGIQGDWRALLKEVRKALTNEKWETSPLGSLSQNSSFEFGFAQWVTAEEVQLREIEKQDVHANIWLGTFRAVVGNVDLGFEESPKNGAFSFTIKWAIDEERPDRVAHLKQVERAMREILADVCDRYSRPMPPALKHLSDFSHRPFGTTSPITQDIVSEKDCRIVASVGRTIFVCD